MTNKEAIKVLETRLQVVSEDLVLFNEQKGREAIPDINIQAEFFLIQENQALTYAIEMMKIHKELVERLKVTNRALQATVDSKLITPGVRMTLEATIKYNQQALSKAEAINDPT